jgi:hypothetical protein
MKSWIRNSLLALCALLVMAGAAYYWLIVESHVPGGATSRRLRSSLRLCTEPRYLCVEPGRPIGCYAKFAFQCQSDPADRALVEKTTDERNPVRHAARRVELR